MRIAIPKRQTALASSLALAAALLAASASATVILAVGLDELTRTSDVIFVGRVLRVGTVVPPGQVVHTEIAFAPTEILKGQSAFRDGKLTLRVVGGRNGEYEVRIPGMPQFREGEEVLLFLQKTADNYAIAGLPLGVFRIHRDPATGKALVTRRLNGVGVARRGPDGVIRLGKPPRDIVDYPLEDLLAEIRAYIQAPPAPTSPAAPASPGSAR